jgi:hypothetical protein
MWNFVSVCLETVLVFVKERCTVCAEHTTCLKIVLDDKMELLGDLGHVESRFGPFADSANLDARLVHGLCQTYHRLRNYFGRIGWNS